MKKILLIILVLSLSMGLCNAANNDKETTHNQEIPILIINNSYPDTRKTLAKVKSDLPIILSKQVSTTLSPKFRTTLVDNTYGLVDVSSAEKNDLLTLFKETNYPVMLLIEILPVQLAGGFIPDDSVTIHLKILDVKNENYLYNGKLWATKSTARRAMQEINVQLDKVLQDTLLTTEKPSS